MTLMQLAGHRLDILPCGAREGKSQASSRIDEQLWFSLPSITFCRRLPVDTPGRSRDTGTGPSLAAIVSAYTLARCCATKHY
jgi:hypothetical protein